MAYYFCSQFRKHKIGLRGATNPNVGIVSEPTTNRYMAYRDLIKVMESNQVSGIYLKVNRSEHKPSVFADLDNPVAYADTGEDGGVVRVKVRPHIVVHTNKKGQTKHHISLWSHNMSLGEFKSYIANYIK